jgi:hypothetical protein
MNEGFARHAATGTPLDHDLSDVLPFSHEQPIARDVPCSAAIGIAGLALSSRIFNLDPSLSRASPLASPVRPGGGREGTHQRSCRGPLYFG